MSFATPARMDRSDACLHPYRKRKFFYALADLFKEPRPAIRRLEDFFPEAAVASATTDAGQQPQPPDRADGSIGSLGGSRDEQAHATISQRSNDTSKRRSSSSQEPEEDSFEYVDFDKSRASLDSSASLRMGVHSQSSVHDSMQDSLLFLPPELLNQEASVSLSATATDGPRFSQDLGGPLQPTILSLAVSERRTELVDYYDLDRYGEAVPCWAYDHQSSCALHTEPIRRPMVLFGLQALDEFISASRADSALVVACRLARMVLAFMWEQDVRKVAIDGDIVLADYVSEKRSLPGVALDVWKIIDSCWRTHKQQFLHHQELYFVEADATPPSGRVEQWRRVRDLLQVYALRPELARRLEAELPPGTIYLEAIQPQVSFPRGAAAHVKAVQFGLAYLQHVQHKGGSADEMCRPRRDLLSQSDWKVAFSAIEIHLKKWSRDVQVFPCGVFPRGAAFGSVVDVLVGLPEHGLPEEAASPIHAVLKVLSNAKIVEQAQAYLLSTHRALAMIPFKQASLILDVKAYRRPQSWFALLYYTGPETFTQSYFSRLLKRPLAELSVVDFDHIYECVIEQLGLEEVASVDSEKHLFDLINTDYILPSQRM